MQVVVTKTSLLLKMLPLFLVMLLDFMMKVIHYLWVPRLVLLDLSGVICDVILPGL